MSGLYTSLTMAARALSAQQLGQGELDRTFAGEQPFDLGVRQRFGRALEGEPQTHRGRHRA